MTEDEFQKKYVEDREAWLKKLLEYRREIEELRRDYVERVQQQCEPSPN